VQQTQLSQRDCTTHGYIDTHRPHTKKLTGTTDMPYPMPRLLLAWDNKVIWEEHVTTPHDSECTRPLNVQLVTTVPTADKSNHSAALQYHMHLIYYISLSDSFLNQNK